MKKRTPLIAAFVLLLIISLAACGGNNDSGEENKPSGNQPTNNPSTPAPLEIIDIEENIPLLPISTVPVTFTIWATLETAAASIMQFQHESVYFQQLEERTGVTIRFIHPPAGGAQENLNLMIAAGDYPDVLQMGSDMYAGGFGKAIADGFLIDVKDLVREHAPFYWNLINQDEEHRRRAFTDNGQLPGFHQIAIPQPPWIGLTTRQDWLDDLGEPTPVTYDDWERVLLRFKNEKGANAPFMISNNGFMIFDVFQAGYGFAPGFFQIDGKVQYGPLTDGFFDYVTMMKRWYDLGILDPDFMAGWYFVHPRDYTTTGRAGLWQDVYIILPINKQVATDPNYHCVAVPTPVRTPGQKVPIHQRNEVIQGNIWVVSDNCKDPVTFTKWMNYVYSPEGALHANYGIEGDTFFYDENGDPKLTEKMYNNPDMALTEALRQYTRGPVGGFYYDWRRELTTGVEQDVLDALDIWISNVDYAYMLPPITLNPEEGNENTRIMNDINTYRDEMVVRFITGAEPMDNYDTFINTIKGMNINRALELQQGALDRFYRR